MLNIDRVKGILRAKQGSQVPKFQYGNPLMVGSNIPTPKPPPELLQIGSNPIGDLTLANIQAGLQYILNKVNKDANFDARGTAKRLHLGFTDGSLYTKDGKIYRKFSNTSQYKDIAEKQKFTDTKFGKGVAKAGDFIGNAILDNSDIIMLLAGSIARNSVDIQGDNFGKFDRTTQNIAAFGKLMGGPAGDVISAFATGINTWGNVINAIGAKKLQNFSVDKKLQERVGGAYAGSYKDINKAGDMAGKKVGLFANASGKNNFINEQRRILAKIAGIDQTNLDMLAMAGNDLNYLNYQMQSDGGYNLMYMGMRAKQGGKLLDKINLVKSRKFNQIINVDTKQVEEFKEGGKIQTEWEPIIEDLWEPVIELEMFQEGGSIKKSFEEWFNSIPKDSRASGYDYKKAYEVLDWETLSKHAKDPENNHLYSVSPIADENGNYPFLKLGKIEDNPEIQGEFDWYNSEEGKEHKSKFDIEYINDRYYYVPKINFEAIKKFFKDYDINGVNFIRGLKPRTEGNKIYINTDEDAVHELWHFLSRNKPNEKYKEFYDNLNDDRITALGGDLNFVKRHEGDPGHFYHPSELEARIMAAKFKSLDLTYTKDFFKNLRSDENKYGYNMRDLLYMFNDENLEKIFNLKKGGTLEENLETPEIEETNQKNLIPEGALHKNKHHMEHTEGLTLKGIPVIDNEGEQLAEIELDEIIFTLEVTKKLEELYKEGTDEAAIEAGKLLVKEILFNTDDRTGLIAKCLEGGKL